MLRDLDTLMLGRDGWQEAAQRLHADCVYWGARERAHFPGSTRPWAHGQPDGSGSEAAVFDLRAR
jgi:hypothetical protein